MASDFVLIAQIESAEALKNIDGIAAADGIDMLFIGPADLSASLGALGDFSSRKFTDAISRIEKAARDAGKFLGTIPIPGYSAADLYRAGHQLVLSGTDTMLLKQAAESDLAMLRMAAATAEEG
jgi:2-keto-3-deoxy-L-rhamnonate aldolase RhmA